MARMLSCSGDQFTDGRGSARPCVGATRERSHLVAEHPRHAIAVVAVGDEYLIGGDQVGNGATRTGSVTRSTTCATPSTSTRPTGSPLPAATR